MVKNFITAEEASKLTNTSDKLLNQVFKVIREAASYGHCFVKFDVFDVADTVICNIKNELIKAGFSAHVECVSTDTQEDVPEYLLIEW